MNVKNVSCGLAVVLALAGAAQAGIIQSFTGAGYVTNTSSAAYTARNNFLAGLQPGFVSETFSPARQDDAFNTAGLPWCTLDLSNYQAGTGNVTSQMTNTPWKPELDKGVGFIVGSGSGFAAGSNAPSISGGARSFTASNGGDARFWGESPGFGSRDGTVGSYLGLAPISGVNGSYALKTGIKAMGISIGSFGSSGEVPSFSVSFYDTLGTYIGQVTGVTGSAGDNTTAGGKAYIGVYSNVDIGAVVPRYSGGTLGQAYQAFDYGIVPEPATLSLAGIGGLLMLRRRRA